ncbi:MAG: C45 family autoproteolytic acyltransferase/hydrolase [Myxococcota bacterium]
MTTLSAAVASSSPVVTPEPASARHMLGPAWHRRVHGVDVLKLKGSFREMGHQHGTLLRDRVATGPIPYYQDFAHRLMGRSLGRLTPVVMTGIQQLIGRRVAKALPPYAVETIEGLAAGAGLPLQDFVDGCTMPDSLIWLAARLMQIKMRGPAVRHRLALGLGCTSAIAWGEATVDGKLYHARNFDYYGVGNWPSHTAVIFHEPNDGQRYVSVAAAGVGLGGVTAMNESGLSLTVHQHMFTDATRLGGTPIGVVGDVVMRHARNLDDAQRILSAHRHIGCWTYLVTDAHRKEVLCWEENPDRQAPRRIGAGENTFGYANIYLDEELGSTEQNLYGSYWRHNQGRHQRTNQLLAEKRGNLDVEGLAGILADRGHARCRVADSIGMVMTVGSVVFRPEDGVVWVGAGEAPTSRGTFVPFSLRNEDHDPTERTFVVDDGETEAQRAAFDAFRQAYIAYIDENDTPAARAHVERAAALCPDQPVYHTLSGLFALSLRDANSAERAFTTALSLGHPHEERVASFHLWRARARDVLGARAEALKDYRAALAHHADGPVHQAARWGLTLPYTAGRCDRIHVDVALADVISP